MPAALDQVFKAYDVRGTYPDQLDEEVRRKRVGRAFVASPGRAPGHRAGHAAVDQADGRRLAAGAMAQGADVLRVGLCSTDMLCVSGALDVAGVMVTASHNPARYNGLKLCRPAAVPVGEESGLADIKRMVAAGEPAAAAGRRGRERQADDLLERYAAHVRSFAEPTSPRPLQGGRRRRQRHGRPRRPGRVRRPAVRAGGDVLRAGQLPQPPGRPAEPGQPARAAGQGGGRGRRRRAGLRRRRRPGVRGRRAGRRRPQPGRGAGGRADVRTRAGRDRALQPDLLAGRARDDPRGRRRRCAPASATPSSRRSWPRPGPSSPASTPATTTSATTTGPTPA